MAYVDHAFSISDEDIMVETSYVAQNRPPIKESGSPSRCSSSGPWPSSWVRHGRKQGLFFAALGAVLFLPGFYYTRIAYYAYKGYKGFSFANIPPV
ncbi:unnamed protein product [Spirodela intermedia]|uniref:Transmembrane protein 230 n=1 Tax=Spirodela intermedia TaxID=51605 RepID=A0A7I8JPV0_SPIIN|nr:unnamed protein product [Spirodela intermedia]CAA6672176.1 unnamed protein product [Spirodela intermedia]